jgi:hypothetical protein
MLDHVLPEPKHKRIAGEDDAIIKLAVLAVGGQGGGVLADWIVFPPEIIQPPSGSIFVRKERIRTFPNSFSRQKSPCSC